MLHTLLFKARPQAELLSFFFLNEPATTEIYTYGHTLSLHDPLPIWFTSASARARKSLSVGAALPTATGPAVAHCLRRSLEKKSGLVGGACSLRGDDITAAACREWRRQSACGPAVRDRGRLRRAWLFGSSMRSPPNVVPSAVCSRPAPGRRGLVPLSAAAASPRPAAILCCAAKAINFPEVPPCGPSHPAGAWAWPGSLRLPGASKEAFRLRFSRSEEHTSELQSLMRISYAV